MRFRSAIVSTLLLSLIGSAAVRAQLTPSGILDVFLKAREAADAPIEQKVTLYQKSKALVIGMDHYTGGWPQLSNGIKDAEEVAKALTAQGFEVILKKDLKSDDLDRTLKDFFIVQGDDPNARLLLWYAGHGDTINGEAYMVPVDAPLASKSGAEFRTKAISLRRFGEYMREANARHVLALFDSCFSGGVFNVARSAPPPAITLATTQPVREFISSGEAEQQVSDDGTFRKLFLDVLAGKESEADANHDGYVTGTELGLFLHQKMTNLTNNRQTPRYGKLNAFGYDRGDFVFQVGKPDVPTATVPTAQQTNEAAQAWTAIKDTKSSAEVESFLRRYGDSFYGDLARIRLDELKKSQLAVVAPPTPGPASPGPCGSGAPATVSLSSRSAQPLSVAEECALKPKDVFKECDKCPEMIVFPTGSFNMGSPASEPEHSVSISRRFAVGRVTVTFDEWDACVGDGGCNNYKPDDAGLGRGQHPVKNVGWNDAKSYVTWLSRKTGKSYRLLSEAELEYVVRAGTNGTGFEWVEDCFHDNTHTGAPTDGSAWISGDCKSRVLRGGPPRDLHRIGFSAGTRLHYLSFRLGRTLTP